MTIRKLRLFLDFAPHLGHHEVPDPYYGGDDGFELVLDLVEEATKGLLEHLRRELERESPARPIGAAREAG